MARPKTKAELISAANAKFDLLFKFISSATTNEKTGQINFDPESTGKEAHWKRDKNFRDLLIHLYEWHQLLLNWVKSNQSGDARPFLPAPYNWKTYGDMNVEFWRQHQKTPFEDAEKMLKKSHQDCLNLIEQFSDQELFTKAHFSWTGTTSLGSYAVSALPSHYDWAITKIKKYQKSQDKS